MHVWGWGRYKLDLAWHSGAQDPNWQVEHFSMKLLGSYVTQADRYQYIVLSWWLIQMVQDPNQRIEVQGKIPKSHIRLRIGGQRKAPILVKIQVVRAHLCRTTYQVFVVSVLPIGKGWNSRITPSVVNAPPQRLQLIKLQFYTRWLPKLLIYSKVGLKEYAIPSYLKVSPSPSSFVSFK